MVRVSIRNGNTKIYCEALDIEIVVQGKNPCLFGRQQIFKFGKPWSVQRIQDLIRVPLTGDQHHVDQFVEKLEEIVKGVAIRLGFCRMVFQ
jgi:hypothetical protein